MKRVFLLCFLSLNWALAQQTVKIALPQNPHPRVVYGVEKVREILQKNGYLVQLAYDGLSNEIIISNKKQSNTTLTLADSITKKEGFLISKQPNKSLIIKGFDASGILYGCLELAEIIKKNKNIPHKINLKDQPEMVLRGTCIGLQKSVYLPGREVYEYPYTSETFPWFYDKSLWIKYLDMMVANRYNSLYLWNGHPFASLVRLKDYPYAVEVDEATFQKNEEIYRFLTTEADKRGIWVIQMFYNIIISKPFAEKHQLKTQDRNRPILPLIADYTRKSIAAFVEKYPNVGLLVTLGEAMEGQGQDDVDWFTKTIIPGVKDGLRALGKTDQPPIVLRAHDTDAPRVMKAALPIYKNLFTMAKYNGEALTTYTPRGSWAELHRKLSRIGTVHIENVHILANLEPFRYSSPDFIQKSVQAMHSVYEANGLHLYPQASYWDWPYTADKTTTRLLQLDRDALWYKTWGRYAWQSNRDRVGEMEFWANELALTYHVTLAEAKNILKATEEVGEISPKLLRRYGITDGNRQTLTLGMLMTQLINPDRYGFFKLMSESEAPEGETILEYAEKEALSQPHIGETPVIVASEVIEHGRKAVIASEQIVAKKDIEEFKRWQNDVQCYNAMANFYAFKVRAALAVLKYKYSNKISDLESAMPDVEKSVEWFEKLTNLTKNSYLYANSMQTQQRKIPMRGVNATFIHWSEMLPVYQKELANFKYAIDSIKNTKATNNEKIVALKPADVYIKMTFEGYFNIQKNESIFSDTTLIINNLAEELVNLKGIKLNKKQQQSEGTSISFETAKAVKLLVGFFNDKNKNYLPPPQLEIDASANNYGQSEIKILNALLVGNSQTVNVHSYQFKAGVHTLNLGKGACVILGFIEDDQPLKIRNTGFTGNKKNVDWLFEKQ
jgi:hypothetical protein